MARFLMIQGSSSSVGKSLIVAGLCRLFARRGIKVAPFKSQNMSNNAAVCPGGGEIGRAQAVQAAAAGIAPTVDMNPILLKPEADQRSQVILHGRPFATLNARSYHERKRQLWSFVTASLERLRTEYELIIVEGAGSPVELNLAASDIVNMAVARHLQCPVLLVGDIDRGGVFAQLLGTLHLLEADERRFVRGLIVNKFRGDPTLFAAGIGILEERGGLPVLGVLPYLLDLGLPDEDGAELAAGAGAKPLAAGVDVAIIRLPHIANFDDFDPLFAEPGLSVRYVDCPEELGEPAAIILPGTKSTMADLAWLRQRGLADAVVHCANRGAAVVGICGGYQMLGRVIHDAHAVERSADAVASVPGLGLLPTATTFHNGKATFLVDTVVHAAPGWLGGLRGATLTGYEIHSGRTESPCPWLRISREGGEVLADGAFANDGRVWGCYLHGLFANDALRGAWLASLGHRPRASEAGKLAACPTEAFAERQRAAFDRLADAFERHLNIPHLERIIAEGIS